MTLPALFRSPGLGWLTATLAVLTAVLAWAHLCLTRLENHQLLYQAGSSTAWALHGCVVAIIAGACALVPKIHKLIGRHKLLMALGLGVAGYLACGLAPRAHRILFDEHIYMQIGQTFAHTGVAASATYARTEYGDFQLIESSVNKQPNGLPYLHGLSYRLFGVSTTVSHHLNRVLIGFGAAFLYLALTLASWKLPRGTPVASALLFMATPLVPWWGHTTAVEPAAATSVILAFFAACLYVQIRDPKTVQGTIAASTLLAGTTAFAVYFRPESLLVLPLVAAVLWSEEDFFLKDFFAWGALILVLALILPNLLHLWSVRGEDWGATDGQRFSAKFIGKNFRSNAGYFFTSTWFPLAGTLLAAVGALWLAVRNLALALVIGLWFALGWGVFVLFYAGGYHYGASNRYALVSAAPVAILMGVGAARIFQAMHTRYLLCGASASVLALNWLATFSYVPTESREAAAAREDIRFVVDERARLPHASLVISRAPTVWLVEGANAAELPKVESLIRNHLREMQNQYPGGIYFHFGYWDNSQPEFAEEAARLIVDMEATEFARRQCQEHRFALFRLDTSAAVERFGGSPPEPSDRMIRLDSLLEQLRNPPPPGDDASPSEESKAREPS
jgi:hypothetical protein